MRKKLKNPIPPCTCKDPRCKVYRTAQKAAFKKSSEAYRKLVKELLEGWTESEAALSFAVADGLLGVALSVYRNADLTLEQTAEHLSLFIRGTYVGVAAKRKKAAPKPAPVPKKPGLSVFVYRFVSRQGALLLYAIESPEGDGFQFLAIPAFNNSRELADALKEILNGYGAENVLSPPARMIDIDTDTFTPEWFQTHQAEILTSLKTAAFPDPPKKDALLS